MRPLLAAGIILELAAVSIPLSAGDKLTPEERVELVRGLMAEYATVKDFLPRSKKPLVFDAKGTWDKKKWEQAGKEFGPAARVGDQIQITKVELDGDRILLEINNGLRNGPKWYQRIQVGGGMGGGGRMTPIAGDSNAAAGTNVEVNFHKPLENLKAADVKKLLAPLLDFEKHSATEIYAQTLPPEVQQAIKEKRAREGMDREQVQLALGRPVHKTRETKDGIEYEDWIYGTPPGKITFVTFTDSKVIKIKETYAGLGAEAAVPLEVPR
jgi:hypothetical protein